MRPFYWNIAILCCLLCPSLAQSQTNVTLMEYFFNTDPGAGNGITVPVGASAQIDVSVSINTASLAPGFHTLYLRARNADGVWGLPESRAFYVTESPASAEPRPITRVEYFINQDPGVGSGTAVSVESASQIDIESLLATTSLAPGFHTLYLRARNADGVWGLPESRAFYVTESPASAEPRPITSLEYFIGDDPGYGAGTILNIAEPATQIDLITIIPTVNLETGRHSISLRAKNADGVWGLQQTEVFDVQDLPGTALLTPINETGPLAYPLMFTWTAVEEAQYYQLQLSESREFDEITVDSTRIEATELGLDEMNLAYSTTYFWRVRTMDDTRVGPWTDAWSFTTRSAIANAPILLSPADSTLDAPIPINLRWQLVEGAEFYVLEVSDNLSFDQSQRWDSLTVAERVVNGITDTTTYYWRVTAAAVDSEPEASAIWRFRTELRLPDILVWGDGDGVSASDSTMIFKWSAISRATRYDLQISTDSTFSVADRNVSGIASTSVEVGDLDGTTRYHWRIRGENSRGAGGWSDSRSFTTPVFTSIDNESSLPTETSLRANYPNPFNPSTVIAYQLALSGNVKLSVFDVLGREVAVLVNGVMPAGSHTVTFDASNLTSGMYLYRLDSGGMVFTRKMMLVK